MKKKKKFFTFVIEILSGLVLILCLKASLKPPCLEIIFPK